MSSSKSKLSRLKKQNAFYWGHCGEYLSRAAFWKHRKAYFNGITKQWRTKASIDVKRDRSINHHAIYAATSSVDITKDDTPLDDTNMLSDDSCSSTDDSEMLASNQGKRALKLHKCCYVHRQGWSSKIFDRTSSVFHMTKCFPSCSWEILVDVPCSIYTNRKHATITSHTTYTLPYLTVPTRTSRSVAVL